MDALAEGDRAAERIFTPRRPPDADLAGKAGMDMLSWFARTVTDQSAFRLSVSSVFFESLAVFRLTLSRSVMDRTASNVSAVSVGSAFYLVTRGSAILHQNGRDILMSAGSSAMASGESPHQFRVPDSADTILVVVRKGVFFGRGAPHAEEKPRRFPATSFTDGASRFLQVLASDLPAPMSPAGITSQQAILSLLTGLVLGTSEERQDAGRREFWIGDALAYIQANYVNADLTTSDVATAVGISSRHLQRIFASTESSVADELRRTRVRWASAWLSEDARMRLDEVAEASGFGTAARMRRAFRRQLGLSPLEYQAATAATRTQ